MAAHVLTVAQQKGGAGKTTLAAHLGVALVQRGARVALLDIDPQGSLSAWAALRAEEGEGPSHRQAAGWRTAQEAERLQRDHDVVIIDSPPHAETEARIAIRQASLVLVPVQPSPMDFWATAPTLDLVRAEQGWPLLVLNRVPPRAKLADTLIAHAGELGVPIAQSRIGSRVGFAAAMMTGRGITEAEPRSTGAGEITALAKELLDLLDRG
jgi:chromosome partitioning protein